MKRTVLLTMTVASAALLSACGGGRVAVQAQLEEDGEAQPLSDLEVWLLPYDRDAVFDSLAEAHPEPEPQISDSVLDLQDRVIAAQRAWQEAQAEWNALRDSLRAISEQIEGLSRASGEYVALFREFNELEPRVEELDEETEELFQTFTQLQSRLTAQTQEIRFRRANWGDEAFADVDAVFATRIEELGREPRADTTDATGVTYFSAPAGDWWVYSRYELPFMELYWNEPIEVVRGETVTVRLNEETAERRQKF